MLLVQVMDGFVCLVILPLLKRCGSVCGTLPCVKCPWSWDIFGTIFRVYISILSLGSVIIIHRRLMRLWCYFWIKMKIELVRGF